MKVALILLMGGVSSRFNSSIPKQFLPLNGHPLYQTTLNRCKNAFPFSQIILVTLKPLQDKNVTLVEAGSTRQESCKNALQALNPDIEYVMIHDAARPFITKEIIMRHIDALPNYHAVDTCIPATDTMIISKTGVQIDSIPSRKLYYNGQTPQSFTKELIIRAHQTTLTDQTDDCALVLALNHPVHIVKGSPDNFKITTPYDYEIAKLYLKNPFPTPSQSLKKKRYIITGANSKIAQELILKLEQQGAIPIPIREKLTTPAQIATLFKQHGFVDGLINCMGSLLIKPFGQLTPEQIDQELHNNFVAALYACKEAQLNPSSHILNIGSSAAQFGRPNYALYSASKAALTNFTQAIALEQPQHYINTLSPSRTNTPMRKSNFPHEDPKVLLTPEQVAEKALTILASTETGNTYNIF